MYNRLSYTTNNTDSFRVRYCYFSFITIIFNGSANANGGLFESTAIASSLNKVSSINVTTMAGAVDALKVVDRALDRVHMKEPNLGFNE